MCGIHYISIQKDVNHYKTKVSLKKVLKVKKKCVFFLLGIVYLKKGLIFELLINHKIINTMKTLSNILTVTFLTALFIYTLIVLTAGLFLTLGFNLPLNDFLLSISGTLFIVSFSYIYTNLNN